MRLRWFYLLVALLLLVGCAGLKPAPQNGFSAAGRVSIRSGSESHYANFEWQSEPKSDQISFNNPLGQTLAELSLYYRGIASDYAVLTDSDGKSRVGDPEQLLRDATGMQLPVSGLRWWLQGQAAPGEATRSDTPDGVRIEQDGWQILATDFSETIPVRRGPHKIVLTHGDVTVRIAISEWQWQTSLQP